MAEDLAGNLANYKLQLQQVNQSFVYTKAAGKMRTCGSADFGTGSGENYGLRLRLGFV